MPRRELSEEAFRRYEKYISEAQQNSLCVWDLTLLNDPNFKRPMGYATFIARLHDAITGFRRYHYYSTLVDSKFDWKNLTIGYNRAGHVVVDNKKVSTFVSRLCISNQEVLLKEIPKRLAELSSNPDVIILVYYDSPSEREWAVTELPKLVKCDVNTGARLDRDSCVRIYPFTEKKSTDVKPVKLPSLLDQKYTLPTQDVELSTAANPDILADLD